MTEQQVPLAEFMAGTGLFAVGIAATWFYADIPAAVCFIMVGLIAISRSYTRTL